jgi:hypothetical protein
MLIPKFIFARHAGLPNALRAKMQNPANPAWSATTAYKREHVVYHGGDWFQAKTDNSNIEPDFTKFTPRLHWSMVNLEYLPVNYSRDEEPLDFAYTGVLRHEVSGEGTFGFSYKGYVSSDDPSGPDAFHLYNKKKSRLQDWYDPGGMAIANKEGGGKGVDFHYTYRVSLFETCHGTRPLLTQGQAGEYNFYNAFYAPGYYQPPYGENPTLSIIGGDEGIDGQMSEINMLAGETVPAGGCCKEMDVKDRRQYWGIRTTFPTSQVPMSTDVVRGQESPIHAPSEECPPDFPPSVYFVETSYAWHPGSVMARLAGNFYNDNPFPTPLDVDGHAESHVYKTQRCYAAPHFQGWVLGSAGYPILTYPLAGSTEDKLSTQDRSAGTFLSENQKTTVGKICNARLLETNTAVSQCSTCMNIQLGAATGPGAAVNDQANFFGYNDAVYWHWTFRYNAEEFFNQTHNTATNTVTQFLGGEAGGASTATEDHYWTYRQCPNTVDYLPYTVGQNINACPNDYFDVPYYAAIGKFGFYGARFFNKCGRTATSATAWGSTNSIPDPMYNYYKARQVKDSINFPPTPGGGMWSFKDSPKIVRVEADFDTGEPHTVTQGSINFEFKTLKIDEECYVLNYSHSSDRKDEHYVFEVGTTSHSSSASATDCGSTPNQTPNYQSPIYDLNSPAAGGTRSAFNYKTNSLYLTNFPKDWSAAGLFDCGACGNTAGCFPYNAQYVEPPKAPSSCSEEDYRSLLKIAKNEQRLGDFYAGNVGFFLWMNWNLLTASNEWNNMLTGEGEASFKHALWRLKADYDETLGLKGNFMKALKDPIILYEGGDGPSDLFQSGPLTYSTDSSITEDIIFTNNRYERFLREVAEDKRKNIFVNGDKAILGWRTLVEKYGTFAAKQNGKVDQDFYKPLIQGREKRLLTRYVENHNRGFPTDLFPLNHITFSVDQASGYANDLHWGKATYGDTIDSSASFEPLPTVSRRYFEGVYASKDLITGIQDIVQLSRRQTSYFYGGLYKNPNCGADLPRKLHNIVAEVKGNTYGGSIPRSPWKLEGLGGIGRLDPNFSCFTPIFVQQPLDAVCKVGQSPTFRSLAVDYHTIPEDKVGQGYPEIDFWVNNLKLTSSNGKSLYPINYQWYRIKIDEVSVDDPAVSTVPRTTQGAGTAGKGQRIKSSQRYLSILDRAEPASLDGNWACIEGKNGSGEEDCSFFHPWESVGEALTAEGRCTAPRGEEEPPPEGGGDFNVGSSTITVGRHTTEKDCKGGGTCTNSLYDDDKDGCEGNPETDPCSDNYSTTPESCTGNNTVGGGGYNETWDQAAFLKKGTWTNAGNSWTSPSLFSRGAGAEADFYEKAGNPDQCVWPKTPPINQSMLNPNDPIRPPTGYCDYNPIDMGIQGIYLHCANGDGQCAAANNPGVGSLWVSGSVNMKDLYDIENTQVTSKNLTRLAVKDGKTQYTATHGDWGTLVECEGVLKPTGNGGFYEDVTCLGIIPGSNAAEVDLDRLVFRKGAKAADEEYYYFNVASGRFGMNRSEYINLETENWLRLDVSVRNGSASEAQLNGSFLVSPWWDVGGSEGDSWATLPLKAGLYASAKNPWMGNGDKKNKVMQFAGVTRDPNAVCETTWKSKIRMSNNCKSFAPIGIDNFRGTTRTYLPPVQAGVRGTRADEASYFEYGLLYPFGMDLDTKADGLGVYKSTRGDMLYGYQHLPKCHNYRMTGGRRGPRLEWRYGPHSLVHYTINDPAVIGEHNPPGLRPRQLYHHGELYPQPEGPEYNDYAERMVGFWAMGSLWQGCNLFGKIPRFGHSSKLSKPFMSGGDMLADTKNYLFWGGKIPTQRRNFRDAQRLIHGSVLAGDNCGWCGSGEGLGTEGRDSSVGRMVLHFWENYQRFYLSCDSSGKKRKLNYSYIAPGLRKGSSAIQFFWGGNPYSTYAKRTPLYGPYAYEWKTVNHNRDRNGNGLSEGFVSTKYNERMFIYDPPAVYGLYLRQNSRINEKAQYVKDWRRSAFGPGYIIKGTTFGRPGIKSGCGQERLHCVEDDREGRSHVYIHPRSSIFGEGMCHSGGIALQSCTSSTSGTCTGGGHTNEGDCTAGGENWTAQALPQYTSSAACLAAGHNFDRPNPLYDTKEKCLKHTWLGHTWEPAYGGTYRKCQYYYYGRKLGLDPGKNYGCDNLQLAGGLCFDPCLSMKYNYGFFPGGKLLALNSYVRYKKSVNQNQNLMGPSGNDKYIVQISHNDDDSDINLSYTKYNQTALTAVTDKYGPPSLSESSAGLITGKTKPGGYRRIMRGPFMTPYKLIRESIIAAGNGGDAKLAAIKKPHRSSLWEGGEQEGWTDHGERVSTSSQERIPRFITNPKNDPPGKKMPSGKTLRYYQEANLRKYIKTEVSPCESRGADHCNYITATCHLGLDTIVKGMQDAFSKWGPIIAGVYSSEEPGLVERLFGDVGTWFMTGEHGNVVIPGGPDGIDKEVGFGPCPGGNGMCVYVKGNCPIVGDCEVDEVIPTTNLTDFIDALKMGQGGPPVSKCEQKCLEDEGSPLDTRSQDQPITSKEARRRANQAVKVYENCQVNCIAEAALEEGGSCSNSQELATNPGTAYCKGASGGNFRECSDNDGTWVSAITACQEAGETWSMLGTLF